MRRIDRRSFLSETAFLTACAAMAPAAGRLAADEKAAATKGGPASDKLRVACVGVRGQGMSHVRGYAGRHNCVVTTICDVDSGVIGPAMKHVKGKQGTEPAYEKDIRKVVEDKNIDVISIATPNHWHALAAIWAMQNGKDVYVEKPVSHNVLEGRRIVEASRKYNKICQTGTQSRSQPGMREAVQFIHDGKIGTVKLARGLCYKRRDSIGKVDGPQKPPETMDYDLWCGPAPLKMPHRNSKKNGTVHYEWHWVWDYGNGDLGNQGIHEMDKARWGLKKDCLPNSVVSVGGRFGYVDDGETANTQIICFDYGDCELLFEVRGLPTKGRTYGKGEMKGDKVTAFVGNVWYGSNGFVVCPSYHGGVAFNNDGEVVKKFEGGGDHFGNFIKAVRSRKKEDLNADILEGHLSSALCHLGNVSHRLGKPEPFATGRPRSSRRRPTTPGPTAWPTCGRTRSMSIRSATRSAAAKVDNRPEVGGLRRRQEGVGDADPRVPYRLRRPGQGLMPPARAGNEAC
ncbi:MAG: Gfo/Idh/MocA family oxidoreductase [Gemmataceae bacterium]